MQLQVARVAAGAVLRRTGRGNIEADGLDLDDRRLHLNQLGRHRDTGVCGGVPAGVDHDQLGGDGDTGGTLAEEARPAGGRQWRNSESPEGCATIRTDLAICHCLLPPLLAIIQPQLAETGNTQRWYILVRCKQAVRSPLLTENTVERHTCMRGPEHPG